MDNFSTNIAQLKHLFSTNIVLFNEKLIIYPVLQVGKF